MALCRVEGGKDHGFSLCVLQNAVFICIEHGIDEGITFILLVSRDHVPVVALTIVVCVLAFDVVLLRLSE